MQRPISHIAFATCRHSTPVAPKQGEPLKGRLVVKVIDAYGFVKSSTFQETYVQINVDTLVKGKTKSATKGPLFTWNEVRYNRI